MAGPHTLEFTEDNFEAEVKNAEGPVLVDFWAEWCGPCKLLGPTIDELATENEGKIKVGKFDVDKGGAVTTDFGIQSIPTVILFKGGEVVERIVGAQSKDNYQRLIDQVLENAGN